MPSYILTTLVQKLLHERNEYRYNLHVTIVLGVESNEMPIYIMRDLVTTELRRLGSYSELVVELYYVTRNARVRKSKGAFSSIRLSSAEGRRRILL